MAFKHFYILNFDGLFMNQKKIQNSGVLLFLLLIFFVPTFWLLSPEGGTQKSIIEGRTLKNFPLLSFQDLKKGLKRTFQGKFYEANKIFWWQFIDNSFQKNVEKASSDQFPLRMEAIQLSKSIDRGIITLAYLGLSDEVIPSDMTSGLYIMRDKSMIISRISRYSASYQKRIDDRIKNYETLLNTYPDINFILFYHERLISSPYHPMVNYIWNADNRQAFDYFEKNKPEKLLFGTFLLSGLEDHYRYYFHTDHHWNIHGALKAYDIIYTILRENYSGISPPLNHDRFIIFPGIEFLGSSARATYYPIEPDIFEVADISFPDYDLNIVGNDDIYNHSEEYQNGNYSVDPYVNHYGNYYGEQQKLLEYIFSVPSDRNLLIIGSSFTRSLQPLIASHYHRTYVVDLRQYEDFSIGEFISQYPIDDVLIIGDNIVAFQDLDWAINP